MDVWVEVDFSGCNKALFRVKGHCTNLHSMAFVEHLFVRERVVYNANSGDKVEKELMAYLVLWFVFERFKCICSLLLDILILWSEQSR